MRRDLEFRLQAVETEQAEPAAGKVRIQLGDGRFRDPHGETITPAAFNLVRARPPLVLILPDNGRDATRP
jgi:hypothetical protein